jgi:hypothetical protein
MRPLDLLGKPFGRLIVVRKVQRGELGWPLRLEPNSFWRCRCSCGTVCIVRGCNLARGITRSCGCYKRECVDEMNTRRWGKHDGLNARRARITHHKRAGDTAP